ncbi:MAG TPA: GMC family oxidoreductase N-terminal domain-containing protein [Candidatus Hydrogenedentes bacterium]|nr:GMC family oxidoreductase N-terminal domain-containing protein [Candidatus Hydrogenedentota bacterium]
MNRMETEAIVVGSGPGGTTLARALARQGKRVLLLERGSDHRGAFYYGTYLGPLIYSDRASLLFTKEGLNIVRPLMLGGATNMFCGCAAPPPPWLKEQYGVDMDAEVNETIAELEIAPLPPELRGSASTRIAGAAQSLGYPWEPQPKFMKPARARAFDCGAKCMLGCRCGAKWNAAEYADEAVAMGAQLATRTRVDRVIVEKGRCVGVAGRMGRRAFEARGQVVILAAGGIGSPRILQASGFPEAGNGMTMDITVMVYGFGNEPGIGKEPPMTWSWENPDEGYMLSTLADPWLLFPFIMALKGLRYPLYWPKWNRLLGIMIKLKDDISGGVFPNGKISKPMTERDRSRMASAQRVCERILEAAGAKPSSIFVTPQRGTHPSGTVRIGTMLDENLQTKTPGLYVCDASVFPEALDRPTVLTIIGLAKRLAKHLIATELA